MWKELLNFKFLSTKCFLDLNKFSIATFYKELYSSFFFAAKLSTMKMAIIV